MTERRKPEAPGMRSFALDSPEDRHAQAVRGTAEHGDEALCPRDGEEPWIRNGALPREPRRWGLAVVVERGRERR